MGGSADIHVSAAHADDFSNLLAENGIDFGIMTNNLQHDIGMKTNPFFNLFGNSFS